MFFVTTLAFWTAAAVVFTRRAWATLNRTIDALVKRQSEWGSVGAGNLLFLVFHGKNLCFDSFMLVRSAVVMGSVVLMGGNVSSKVCSLRLGAASILRGGVDKIVGARCAGIIGPVYRLKDSASSVNIA